MASFLLPPRRDGGLASDTFWNALSNIATAALSFLILIITSRLSGAYWCGVVALGLAMSQQFFALGNYSTGPYQASDISERRSFPDYVAAKAVSVGAMLAAAAVWLAMDWRGRDKALAFLGMLIYQTSDAFSGVIFARCQQKGRLDAACRVRFAKVLAFLAVFSAVLAATRHPLPAVMAASATHAALFLALDMPLLEVFGPLRPRLPGRAAFSILAACSPLALNSFLMMLVHNESRLMVDSLLGAEALAAYSALFMVSFAVALCSDFLMNPQVVRLAAALRDGDQTAAMRTVRAPLAAIACLGAVGVAAGAIVGIPVLSALFGIDLSGHTATLCILLGGGVAIALAQLANTVLVVLRRQALVLPGILLAVASMSLSARPLVGRHGLRGAAVAYALAVGAMSLCSWVLAMAEFHRWTRRHSTLL